MLSITDIYKSNLRTNPAPPLHPAPTASVHPAVALNGIRRPARRLRWARTAAVSAAALLNTGARLPTVPLAGGVAVLGALKTQTRSQRCQMIRVRTAMMVNAMSRTVLLAPTAPTAVT